MLRGQIVDNVLRYCHLCRAYHDVEEGRCAWAWMKWGTLWVVKIFWYAGMALGNVMGTVVLIGWTVLFLGLAYYFIKFLFGGLSLGQ